MLKNRHVENRDVTGLQRGIRQLRTILRWILGTSLDDFGRGTLGPLVLLKWDMWPTVPIGPNVAEWARKCLMAQFPH